MIWTKPLLHLLVNIEPWLNFIVLLVFLKTGASKRFPAMKFFLTVRCVTDACLYFILNEHHLFTVSLQAQTLTYYYAYLTFYLLGAVAIFFALQEVFKAVMDPVPGLQRLGLIGFRWVSVVMAVVVLAMTPLSGRVIGNSYVFASTVENQLVRCVAILEIGLLVYLALSVHSLGRSFRSRVFGIGLGFGLEASGELIASVMLAKGGSIWSLGNLFLMIAGTATLLIWTAYFVLPEPAAEREPITLPATSPLLRWNEIALALGKQPAHVALGAPSAAFFLQDVEQVVDKILTKNP